MSQGCLNIIKHIDLNEKENTTYQKWWEAVMSVLGEIVIALNACIVKEKDLN